MTYYSRSSIPLRRFFNLKKKDWKSITIYGGTPSMVYEHAHITPITVTLNTTIKCKTRFLFYEQVHPLYCTKKTNMGERT